MLFDKIASVYFIEKYIYILALEMASPANQHCANCIGTFVPYGVPVTVSRLSGEGFIWTELWSKNNMASAEHNP